MGDAYLPYMLSWPGVYDGARSSLRRGRRVPEKGAVATNAAGAGKRSSGSIMAHHLQLTHKSASSLSALLLASTFWMERHVPFAEQQGPLQLLVPAVPPEVNGTTPQRLVSVGLPTLALTCISTDTVLTYP